jgi:hypothetical protein
MNSAKALTTESAKGVAYSASIAAITCLIAGYSLTFLDSRSQ